MIRGFDGSRPSRPHASASCTAIVVAVLCAHTAFAKSPADIAAMSASSCITRALRDSSVRSVVTDPAKVAASDGSVAASVPVTTPAVTVPVNDAVSLVSVAESSPERVIVAVTAEESDVSVADSVPVAVIVPLIAQVSLDSVTTIAPERDTVPDAVEESDVSVAASAPNIPLPTDPAKSAASDVSVAARVPESVIVPVDVDESEVSVDTRVPETEIVPDATAASDVSVAARAPVDVTLAAIVTVSLVSVAENVPLSDTVPVADDESEVSVATRVPFAPDVAVKNPPPKNCPPKKSPVGSVIVTVRGVTNTAETLPAASLTHGYRVTAPSVLQVYVVGALPSVIAAAAGGVALPVMR